MKFERLRFQKSIFSRAIYLLVNIKFRLRRGTLTNTVRIRRMENSGGNVEDGGIGLPERAKRTIFHGFIVLDSPDEGSLCVKWNNSQYTSAVTKEIYRSTVLLVKRLLFAMHSRHTYNINRSYVISYSLGIPLTSSYERTKREETEIADKFQ